MEKLVLGVDIGGSGMKAGLVDCETGKLISDRFRIPTPKPAHPEAMAEVFATLVDHFHWKGPVGCGFPAIIDKGVARTAANIDSSWININTENLFSQAANVPVTVINDADAAGIAEIKFGAGKNEADLVFVITVGTGIGSALFYNGVLVPNTELGHVEFKGGPAEHYAANSARKNLDLPWDVWGKRLNEYLHHLERLFVPNLFIIGGGVSKPERFSQFEAYLNTNARVLPAQYLNNAGIIGCALAAWQQHAPVK